MIRVGIVGAGGIGNVHARQYRKRSDVEMFFFDERASRFERFSAAWDMPHAKTLEELISKVDVLDVCVPTPRHEEICLKGIAAGRHIFVEKPMTRTIEGAVKVVEAAKKAEVVLLPGHVVRFFAEYRKAKDIVASGGIGTPAAARARRGGPAPKGTDGWFLDHAQSGGVLLDLCLHDFDWMRWTLGEVESLYSRSVSAKSGQGPDYALTTLKFDNGAVGHVEGTWMDPSGFRTHFEIAGSEGLIQHDGRTNAALRTSVAPSPGEGAPLPNLQGNLTDLEDPFYLEIDHFLKAVEGSEERVVTAHDGIVAVSIGLAAIESATTDRAIAPSRQF